MRLSTMFFLVGLLCTLLLYVPFAYIVLRYLPLQQHRMMENRADIVGTYIERQAVPLILVEDNLALNELLIQSCDSLQKIDFIFIVNANGVPIASTFKLGVPKSLLDAYPLSSHESYKDVGLGGIPYLVTKRDLLQGELGTLFLGVNLLETRLDTRSNFILISAFLVFVLIITLAGSVIIGKWISGPLDRLARLAGKVPDIEIGGYKDRIFMTSEIKDLFKAFDSMVQRIKESDKEREDFNRRMLASERLAAVGTLASGVAHEINNPINGIDACFKRMEKTLEAPEKIREYLHSSRKSFDHMKNVVRQLLDFARPQKYSFKRVDINDVIDNMIRLISYRINAEKIDMHKALQDGLPPVMADEQRLSQLFVNLSLNGLDAMPGGGRLGVSSAQEGNNIVVVVSDTGCGIDPNVADKIFEPFFTTKEPGRGTGLGLSVSYRIAREHGGKLELRDRNGKGTSIALILPVYDKEVKDENPRIR